MFYHPYWASFSYRWISHETCADEFIPFARERRRRSARTRCNRRHPIRHRVGWTLVQIGLWLVVRSTEGLPEMAAVLRRQDSRSETDDGKGE
jgi:hypothetical protein